jgi:hypothetical protein
LYQTLQIEIGHLFDVIGLVAVGAYFSFKNP